MIGPISLASGFLDYLANALWQAPLLGAGAFALVRLGGLGPRGRHWAWLACLVLAIALPAFGLVHVAPRPQPTPAISAAVLDQLVLSSEPAPAATNVAPELPPAIEIDPRIAWGLASVFALAAAIGLVRLVVGWLAVRRLLKGAERVDLSSDLLTELRGFARAHRTPMPRIRYSVHIASPAVAGAFAPTILVPQDFADRPYTEVRAALLHELAHVARRDYAVNLASELLALPLWWHPALHLILGEVRRSRELVCDAMASAAMRSERAYAKSLVSLAGAIDPVRSHGAPVAVGLFGKSLLEERLMHLIGPKRSIGPALKAAGLIGGGAVAASVIGAATLLHVSTALAQPMPAQAPEAPAAAPATPAEPAAPAVAAEPAQAADTADDSGDNTVVFEKGRHAHHKHKWVSPSGKTYTVINDDGRDLTPEEQAKLEKDIAKATAEAMKAKALVDSPAFKAQLAEIQSGALQAKLAALKNIDQAKIQAEVARAQATAMREMEPKIRAEREQARLEAMKALDDPKVKAEIERARHLQESPEWRKAEADLKAAAERLKELAREQGQDQ